MRSVDGFKCAAWRVGFSSWEGVRVNDRIRVGVVPLVVIIAALVGALAFSASADAQDLSDYGIGCINGEVVGDVNGDAINCDVDGDVDGDAINSDVTGNVGSCINGDFGGNSGSSINCGSGGAAPGPYPPGAPVAPGAPGAPVAPGAPGAVVVSLPSTGVGIAAGGTNLEALVLVIAAFGLIAVAGAVSLGRREA